MSEARAEPRKLKPMVRAGIWVVIIVLGAAIASLALKRTAPPSASSPGKRAATQPATLQVNRPSTVASETDDEFAPPPPPAVQLPAKSILDLLRLQHADYSTTQPLNSPLPLEECARLVINEPVLLDERGDLWITTPDAEPTDIVLQEACGLIAGSPKVRAGIARSRVHFVREPVAFVYWEQGKSARPLLICSDKQKSWLIDGGKRVEIEPPHHTAAGPATARAASGAAPDGDGFDWPRAIRWNQKYILVPTRAGLCLMVPGASELQVNLSPGILDEVDFPSISRTQFAFDFDGLTAWIPPEGKSPGGRCAVRFNEKKGWITLLPEDGWPLNLLHVVPLMDGSALQIALDPETADDPNGAVGARGERTVKIGFVTLQSSTDLPGLKSLVAPLIQQLSNDRLELRDHALANLRQYGPKIWPILRESLTNPESEEAAVRLRLLLREEDGPTLGGMNLKDGKLRVAWHCRDGGAIFYAGGGIDLPQPDAEPLEVVPAFISVRPGRSIELLAGPLAKQLDVDHSIVEVWGSELVVGDENEGARRFIGNDLTPLAGQGEHAYMQFFGIDGSGRWLLRAKSGSTLVIDPYLPDPKPRLPVWTLAEEAAGWDQNDWPSVKSSMVTTPAALEAGRWRKFDEGTDHFSTTMDFSANVSATSPATVPATATSPVTAPARELVPLEPGETALYTDIYGNRFLGGVTAITIVRRNGKRLDWPLPATAVGTYGPADVHLIDTPDHHLFLFNAPGRVVRLRLQRPGPERNEPLALEAVFSHRIPEVEHPTRVWMDPSGRIDMVYDETKLVIMFPTGHVPHAIAEMIPADQLAAPGEGD